MRMKTKLGTFLLLLSYALCYAQLDSYDQKIALTDIKDQWHTVPLPNTVFSDLQNNLADIRIYGITENDTLEAPYILRRSEGKSSITEVDFKLINNSSNQNGYYFTYEVPTARSINEVHLDFKSENFDWNVMLEGSQNQQEWFTLLEDYRILSIKNNQTDYTFTNLNFSNAKYRYYRLLVKSNAQPGLLSSTLYLDSIAPATYQDYPITDFKVTQVDKNTILSVDLKSRIPVSYLKFEVSDKTDYYRRVEIQYVSDSVKTEKGWRYSYRTLTTGTLSSLEKNEFKFKSTLAKKLKITIHNFDNEPLTFSNPIVKGYLHELVARFDKPANYFLAFGKNNARAPIYDISQNEFKLPENIVSVTMGQTETIPKNNTPTIAPLFVNKWLLWGIMGLIILILGAFTLNMMRQKS